ncbi:MAG: oligoendopeptidase F [Flavobacteriales bacterium]|nr:oligoendopeptidase F [Flavobacteriales bacterium]|tara:strand:- start:837 stop:2531 length:1695 start_codon:yes stop_codon:yes gene_type:complete
MKFRDIPYTRPDLDELIRNIETLISDFKTADSPQIQIDLMKQIKEARNEVETNQSIVNIRHSINTNDEFYDKENKFFDENTPRYSAVINEYYSAVIESPFKKELSDVFGEHFINLAKVKQESFDQSTIDLLKEENKLTSEYNVLIAQLEITVREKKYSIGNISPLLSSPDRILRKEAAEALYTSLEKQQDKFDQIYHELVNIRHKTATKMGFKNYVELGYKKLNRTDYNSRDVSEYRQAILEYVVPVVKKLKVRQKKRLGLDSLKYYDAGFKFQSGNPKPKGTPEEIVKNGENMYRELSDETNEFFQFMLKHELMDLKSKEGKMAGGYAAILGKYKYPFIFSNFNGTAHDVDVLTHEAGHTFQFFRSMSQPIPEYYFPTYEAAEIHSMSMEFFAYPWMNSFFQEDEEKYKFSHLSGSISFLPYGAAIDEFQHFVYENPDISIEERNKGWLEIEKKYDLSADKDNNRYLNSGRFWQKQGHLFKVPFYYIDYALAQVCAFQFWEKSEQNFSSAWKDYLHLCDLGGSLPFTRLVEEAKLKSPFVKDNLKTVVKKIDDFLESIQDSKM